MIPRPTRSTGSSKGLSILMLMPDSYGGSGGIARYGRDLTDALSEMPGVSEVRSLARVGGRVSGALPTGVSQTIAPSRVAFAVQALHCVIRNRPDVIVCGHLHYLGLTEKLAKRSGSRTVGLAYGIDAFSPRGRVTRKGLDALDAIVAVSRHTRRRLLHWSGMNQAKVRVIGGAVRSALSSTTASRTSVDRSKWGLTATDRVLLTVGRMDERERYKGHDRLLDALPSVLALRPEARLVFVGGGSDVGRLRRRVEDEGLTRAVIVLDEVPAAELQALYATADAFAMPSTDEGFGYVFLEALDAGLPVLAGDADGARDPLGDGERGVLVDPSNIDAVRDGMIALIDCAGASAEARRGSKVAPAFRFPAFQFQWQNLLESLLESWLESKRSPSEMISAVASKVHSSVR